jgi:hypothetical protein
MFWNKKKNELKKVYETTDNLFISIQKENPEVAYWLDIVDRAIFNLSKQIKQLEDNQKKIVASLNEQGEILKEMLECDCEDCKKEEKGTMN